MCAFYLAFCTSKKQAVRPDGTGHPVPLTAHLLKRQGAAQLHKKGNVPRSCTHTFYPWWIDKAAKSWENGIQPTH
ncbi:hypothetical protein C814_03340 [Anaerotruncus sp. G3(2012)]|nr:hypothetical protein C814_03340 [Anaerotruncus sp. G3(2012)]